MNQVQLKQALVKAGINRRQLAAMLGIKIKSTYWETVPKSAITILSLLKQKRNVRIYTQAHKALFNTD